MKIIHVCMVDAYAENWAYHRNIISEKNKADGHDVVILTNQYTMDPDGKDKKIEPGVSYTKTGIKIIRLRNRYGFLPDGLQTRFRKTIPVSEVLKKERPDIIMVHNLQFYNLKEIVDYRRNHPKVRLCGDTHADKFNSLSGKHPLRSRAIHFLMGRFWIRRQFKYFDKFIYISVETKEFYQEMYGIDLSNAVFLPLPSPIIRKKEKEKIRDRIRQELGLSDNTLLFIHSGKLAKTKRTEMLFEALKRSNINCKLLIIGSIPDDNRETLEQYIQNESRVCYLGWMSADKLREYIASADLYLQPGTQSVTMCNSLAAGTPVMVYPHKSYQVYFNGCEYCVKNTDDIIDVFGRVEKHREELKEKSEKAYQTACKYFDVDRQAQMLYNMAPQNQVL